MKARKKIWKLNFKKICPLIFRVFALSGFRDYILFLQRLILLQVSKVLQNFVNSLKFSASPEGEQLSSTSLSVNSYKV